MRHPSKRKPRVRHKPPKRGGLVVVNEPKGKTRYYRGFGNTVVTWHDGKFVVSPATATYVRTLARMPKGLARRVREAQTKGKNSG